MLSQSHRLLVVSHFLTTLASRESSQRAFNCSETDPDIKLHGQSPPATTRVHDVGSPPKGCGAHPYFQRRLRPGSFVIDHRSQRRTYVDFRPPCFAAARARSRRCQRSERCDANLAGRDDSATTQDGRTDGRTDRQTDRRTDGRTNGRTDGQTDGRTDGRTNERTDGRTDGQTDGRTDGRTDERTDGRTDGRQARRSLPGYDVNRRCWRHQRCRRDETDDVRNSRHDDDDDDDDDDKSSSKTHCCYAAYASRCLRLLSIYCSAGCVRSYAAPGVATTSDGPLS